MFSYTCYSIQSPGKESRFQRVAFPAFLSALASEVIHQKSTSRIALSLYKYSFFGRIRELTQMHLLHISFQL